jgi:hypothetical protein
MYFSKHTFFDLWILIEFEFVIDFDGDSESSLNMNALSDNGICSLTKHLA